MGSSEGETMIEAARREEAEAHAVYEATLEAEVATWCIEDDAVRREKIQREQIRHPKLIRDLLLDHLDTSDMDVLEVGGGPTPLSDLLPFGRRDVVDPLSDDYGRYFPCRDHIAMKAEEMTFEGIFDLAISTNALDHCECPNLALLRMSDALKAGGFLAIMCAENNALTHPHPAHVHNLTAAWAHELLDHIYETVWELTYRQHGYRYGWVEFNGKRGQPAFALLMRKCVGYRRDQ